MLHATPLWRVLLTKHAFSQLFCALLLGPGQQRRSRATARATDFGALLTCNVSSLQSRAGRNASPARAAAACNCVGWASQAGVTRPPGRNARAPASGAHKPASARLRAGPE